LNYRLLDAFQRTFKGIRYRHRDSSLGDRIAQELYEDLYQLRKSPRFCERVSTDEIALSVRNLARGIRARRGDGTLGERVPHSPFVRDPGFAVVRGHVANVQIGVEVKILAKAMIKQIDRVTNDLKRQAEAFRTRGSRAICVAIVGINQASSYTSYEGTKRWPTDGNSRPHPVQEASDAEARLIRDAAGAFNEFVVLQFRATNVRPYPFEWADLEATELDYGATLIRISNEYQGRFL
jgi:hypothetical protein